MGFFSGLSGTIAGLFGKQSSSSGSSQQTSNTGYGALPDFAQSALKDLITGGQNLLTDQNAPAMFTPLAQTADEATAQRLSQPMSEQDVTDMTNTYMNPFTKYLMENIKNNFQGQNSLYQNQVSGSGFAPGTTNRDFLNTGYMQGQEELAAGTTLANQYQNALTTGLGQRQKTIADLMGQGANARAIAAGTNQAPFSALNALGQILGYMPATSTSQGTSKQSSQSTDNSGGSLGQTIGTIADIASFFL